MICIIGVSGSGKSTLALSTNNSYILTTDLIKDGLRFVINEEENSTLKSLRLPSKKLSFDEAIEAAGIVGRICENFCNLLINKFPKINLICEGFFIPPNSKEVLFLERDEKWLYDVNLIRIEKRHGVQDKEKAREYTNKSLLLQDSLKKELKNCRLVQEIKLDDCVENKDIPLIENTKLIDIGYFSEEILKLAGIEAIDEKKMNLFKEGVLHAYKRTTILK